MQIMHIVGTRPNFMKVAPVMSGLSEYSVTQLLIHTGQHYDKNMSEVFFRELGILEPDLNLNVGSSTHAKQTAQIMMQFEHVVERIIPDLVLVYGDVNSTLAAALVCSKLGIRVGHVEAGLRARDRTMPEEINRILTDQLSDILFTPSVDANENLFREGIEDSRIHLVGNVMIDTLKRLLPMTTNLPLLAELPAKYVLLTLHRPSNVDSPEQLSTIMRSIVEIANDVPVLFPVHPRTRHRIEKMRIPIPKESNLHLMPPLGYIEFLALQRYSLAVITDSGGIQEETTMLGIPCLTLRENTERPITVSEGTNVLVGQDMNRLKVEIGNVLRGAAKQGRVPELWDGEASRRIAQIIIQTHG